MARPASASAVAVIALLAAAFPGVASAHARFVRSTPTAGAVVDRAPTEVRVVFDDAVRVSGGSAAIRNGDGTVLAGQPRIEAGRTLVLPLRAHLANGDYSVRWSVLSDDGHREQGVFAFGVGAGRAPPQSELSAGSAVDVGGAISRTLWLLGVLLAAGAVLFAWAAGTPAEGRQLFAGFLLAFLGASSLGHSVSGTRFGLVTEIGALIALVGGALAALMGVEPRLRFPAALAALALLPLPTLAGHALDPGRPRLVAATFDFAHVTAAAFWLGGLAVLASRRRVPPEVLRRFSQLALLSVIVLAAAGAGRALIELTAVPQLWDTGYGQAILVKTGLLGGALVLGWLNRARLLGAFARLRRQIAVELALLLGAVVAAGVLTELKPGRQAARAAAPVAVARKAALPAPGRLTLAKQSRDVLVALTAGRLPAVTLVGPDGNAYEARGVRVAGAAATTCGVGCWRPATLPSGNVAVQVEGLPPVEFSVPAAARPAGALERAARSAFTAAGSVSVDELLASGPEQPQRSTQRAEAPDRFSFKIANGPEGIVIGRRRWDRDAPGARWRTGVQLPPLQMPAPLWSAGSRNAFEVDQDARTKTIAFLDPTLPAWFEIRVDRTSRRPLVLRMTAPAHFMTERYSAYGTRRQIEPPG